MNQGFETLSVLDLKNKNQKEILEIQTSLENKRDELSARYDQLTGVEREELNDVTEKLKVVAEHKEKIVQEEMASESI
jgi:hypothetical protein